MLLLGTIVLTSWLPGVLNSWQAYGWSADQALAACCRSEYAEAHDDRVPAAAGAPAEREAVEALRAAACGVWRPLSDWQLDRVRCGRRATFATFTD